MAKIKMSESELRQIIRESVENVLNEDGGFMSTPPTMWTPPTAQAGNDRIGPGPSLTRNQADAMNAEANAALTAWNKLGTVGQIREIQKLVGAYPDGKMGPQTLGKIYIALKNRKSGLENVNFRPGKSGTYTNI
jgi:hypothetical protein